MGCCRRSWLAGPQSHWDIYHSGQGSNARDQKKKIVGPNQIGSVREPDCSHSIWGMDVRGV